jgi:putative hydrolase of the HAD superfamily
VTSATLQGHPVAAVLFDYGLTLITHSRPTQALAAAYEHIAATLPGNRWPAAHLLEAVHDRVAARVAEHEAAGILEELDVVEANRVAYRDLGIDLSDAQLDLALRLEQEAWWQGVQVAPGAPRTLQELRTQGLRVGICSNAPYRPASMREQLAHVGLLPLVDAAVFSGEVGWRKPSPRIFEAALTALEAQPATTVMVGDRLREDVDGAHAAGMLAVRLREHYDDPGPPDRAEAVLDRLADLPALLGLDRAVF